jgi:hypothetical protein
MESATITLRNKECADRWVRVVLSLGEDMPSGRCSFIKNEYSCNVKGVKIAANDDPKSWGLLVLSGARCAFALSKTPHKALVVHKLEGFLHEEDVLAITTASAMCVLTLLGKDASQVNTEGWQQDR